MKTVIAGSWKNWNAGRCVPLLAARLVNRMNQYIRPDYLIMDDFDELPELRISPQMTVLPREKGGENFAPDDPFAYMICEDDKITVESLLLDASPGLCDYHIHTPLAYCNEDVEPEIVVETARLLGLRQIGFSEHSGHLYFPESNYWGTNEWYTKGMESSDRFNRTGDYLKLAMPFHSEFCRVGLEADVDRNGNLLVESGLICEMDYLIGAVHHLPEVTNGSTDREMCRNLLFLTGALLEAGCRYIAHPLREITWNNRRRIPDGLPGEMAKLLASYGAAAELNYHKNVPDDRLVLACLENGVKFHFGGDVHAMHELGEFYPQLKQLERLAPGIEVKDIMADFPAVPIIDKGDRIHEEVPVVVNI